MGEVDVQVVAEGTGSAWEKLDDALQSLARAESIMMLLQCSYDIEEHHRCGAQIACGELASLKQKVNEALAQIRSGPRMR